MYGITWRVLPHMCACVGLDYEFVVVFNQVRVRHERPLTGPCSAFLHLLQPSQPRHNEGKRTPSGTNGPERVCPPSTAKAIKTVSDLHIGCVSEGSTG